MKRFFVIIYAILFLFIFSCKSDKVYEDYKSIGSAGWDKDTVAKFSFSIDKNYLAYNLSFNIRNRGDYPYSNLWLFVDIMAPDYSIISDTLEYQMALPNGKWTGKGTGGIYANKFIFRDNVSFPVPGNYTISVHHAMRTNPLVGISDIGLEVKRR